MEKAVERDVTAPQAAQRNKTGCDKAITEIDLMTGMTHWVTVGARKVLHENRQTKWLLVGFVRVSRRSDEPPIGMTSRLSDDAPI